MMNKTAMILLFFLFNLTEGYTANEGTVVFCKVHADSVESKGTDEYRGRVLDIRVEKSKRGFFSGSGNKLVIDYLEQDMECAQPEGFMQPRWFVAPHKNSAHTLLVGRPSNDETSNFFDRVEAAISGGCDSELCFREHEIRYSKSYHLKETPKELRNIPHKNQMYSSVVWRSNIGGISGWTKRTFWQERRDNRGVMYKNDGAVVVRIETDLNDLINRYSKAKTGIILRDLVLRRSQYSGGEALSLVFNVNKSKDGTKISLKRWKMKARNSFDLSVGNDNSTSSHSRDYNFCASEMSSKTGSSGSVSLPDSEIRTQRWGRIATRLKQISNSEHVLRIQFLANNLICHREASTNSLDLFNYNYDIEKFTRRGSFRIYNYFNHERKKAVSEVVKHSSQSLKCSDVPNSAVLNIVSPSPDSFEMCDRSNYLFRVNKNLTIPRSFVDSEPNEKRWSPRLIAGSHPYKWDGSRRIELSLKLEDILSSKELKVLTKKGTLKKVIEVESFETTASRDYRSESSDRSYKKKTNRESVSKVISLLLSMDKHGHITLGF